MFKNKLPRFSLNVDGNVYKTITFYFLTMKIANILNYKLSSNNLTSFSINIYKIRIPEERTDDHT